MDPVAATPVITATPRLSPATPVAPKPEVAGGGVQGIIGDLIRSTTAGYQQATKLAAVQADKAAIVPFETVITGTSLLKDKTANIKGVGKATGLLNTIAGFAMLIMSSNVSSTLRAPGETAVDIGNRVADLIDGKDTAQGWGIGWGIRTDPDEGEETISTLGSALGAAGMK
ncbi:MAG: hypothetical protein JWL76_2074 [Thermoleophilia bacterium]|nr:hypothetical protein [Thermoleophilia bacterium]